MRTPHCQTGHLCLLLALLGATPAVASPLPAWVPPAAADTLVPAPPDAGTLIPGDVVRVRVWREPELSGDFGVDESGTVVLPRLGPTRAGGVPPEELRRAIVARYVAFLNHSSVEVVLLRRVQVLGAVRTPGLYPVDATMTLGDVLALAGGTTPQGHPDRVVLVRRGGGPRVAMSRRTLVSGTPLQSGDQLFVPERGWVSRNPGVVGGITAAVIGLVAALTR